MRIKRIIFFFCFLSVFFSANLFAEYSGDHTVKFEFSDNGNKKYAYAVSKDYESEKKTDGNSSEKSDSSSETAASEKEKDQTSSENKVPTITAEQKAEIDAALKRAQEAENARSVAFDEYNYAKQNVNKNIKTHTKNFLSSNDHGYWSNEELKKKIAAEKKNVEDKKKQMQDTSKKMTEAYNSYSDLCKKYNYRGDPVEISSGMFLYENNDFEAQDFLDKFKIYRKYDLKFQNESFGSGWFCSLDSRIVRCNFSDNSEEIKSLKDIQNDLEKMNKIYKDYNRKYPDYPEPEFDKCIEENNIQINEIKTNISFLEERQKIYCKINEFNKYSCFGRYSNSENYYGFENILIFLDENGMELIFFFCDDGTWEAYSDLAKKQLKIYSLNDKEEKIDSFDSFDSFGGYLVEYRDGRKKIYSKYGILEKEIDRNQNVTEYKNVNGRISEILLKTGERISIKRNEKNFITKISGKNSGSVNYSYKENFLSKVVKDNGQSESYDYDKKSNIIKLLRFNGMETNLTYEFDSYLNRDVCTSVRNGDYYEKFDYFPSEKKVVHSIFDNQKKVFSIEGIFKYDENGNTIYHKERNGKETRMNYNERSLLTSVNYDGEIMTLSYNENFQPVSVSSSEGISSLCSYNEFGQVIYHSDADGFSNKMEYDEKGNLIKTYYCGIQIADFSYYPNGLLKSQLVDGIRTNFEYNRFGTVKKQIEFRKGGELVKTWDYDDKNRPVKYIDEFGYVTEVNYQERNLIENYNNEKRIERKFDLMNREYETVSEDLKNGTKVCKRVEFDSVNGNVKKTYLNNILIEENEYFRPNLLKQSVILPYQNAGSHLEKQGLQFEYLYDEDQNLIEKKCSVVSFEETNGYKSVFDDNVLFEKSFYKKIGDKTEIEMMDFYGKKMSFLYDKKNRLVKKTYGNGSYEKYVYSKAGRLISIVGSSFNRVDYSYKSDGSYVITRVNEKGGKEIIKLDKNHKVFYIKNLLNHETWFYYDDFGQITNENGVNYSKKYIYDKVGRLISFVLLDSKGMVCNEFSVRYDDENRVIETFKNGLLFEKTKYDVFNRMIEKIDANGKSIFESDAMNQIIKKIDGDGNASFFEYNVIGKIGFVKRPDGTECFENYLLTGENANIVSSIDNQKVSMMDFVGTRTDLLFNENESLKSFYNDKTGLLKYVENESRNEVNIIFEDGSNYLAKYDESGNPVFEMNQLGKTALYKYDEINRITEKQNFDGSKSSFSYDDFSNLMTVNLNDEDTYYIEKNVRNQILSMKNKDCEMKFEYDRSGNLIHSYDSLSKIGISYCYDQFGRCISKESDSFKVVYSYDNCGRINEVSEVKSNFSVSRKFNQLGLESSRKYSNGITVEFKWNKNDNIESKVTKNSIGEILNADFLVYDEKGRISIVCDKKGNWQKINYDERGRVVQTLIPYTEEAKMFYLQEAQECGIFVKDTEKKLRESLEFFEVSQLMKVISEAGLSSHVSVKKEAEVWKENIEYTFSGNVKSVKNMFGTIVYEYDKANRIVKKHGKGTDSGGMNFSWTDNNCLAVIQTPYVYIEMTYGVYNRPEIVKINDYKTNEKIVYSYMYDPFGRRISETSSDGRTLKYVYEGTSENLVQCIPLTSFGESIEKFGSQNYSNVNRNETYRFLNDSTYTAYDSERNAGKDFVSNSDSRTFVLIPEEETEYRQSKIDFQKTRDERPFMLLNIGRTILGYIYADNSFVNGVNVECAVSDFKNNVRQICNQNGDCIAENVYDLWGNCLKEEKEAKFSYSKSKIQDGLDMFDLGYRDYMPSIKCFTSEDPARDGANWFSFCPGDSVNYCDPDGMFMLGIECADLMTNYNFENVKDKKSPLLGLSQTTRFFESGCYITTNYNIIKTLEKYGIYKGTKLYKDLMEMNDDKSIFFQSPENGDLLLRSSYDDFYGKGNHDYWTRDNTCPEFIEAELAKMSADLDHVYAVEGIFDLSEVMPSLKNHMVGINSKFDDTGHMTSKESITASSKWDNSRLEKNLEAYSLKNLKEIRYVKIDVKPCEIGL